MLSLRSLFSYTHHKEEWKPHMCDLMHVCYSLSLSLCFHLRGLFCFSMNPGLMFPLLLLDVNSLSFIEPCWPKDHTFPPKPVHPLMQLLASKMLSKSAEK